MTDNFNNELSVGDEVYFASNRGCGNNYKIAKGVIVDFTEDRIKVQPTSGYTDFFDKKPRPILIHSEKIGKVNPK